MITLNIAGTSSGGSSYMRRIVRLRNASAGPMVALIGKGNYQESVAIKVQDEINELELLLGKTINCAVLKA